MPRPETETVVEAALAAIDGDGPRTRALRIADLGTGSGALLVALLSELPNAIGIGTDVSREALAAARDNAGRLGFASRAVFAACDFGAALAGAFDLVVSNPPYIASAEIALLPPEVRHDPRRALDGGADGLGCYRAIAGQAPKLLKPDGPSGGRAWHRPGIAQLRHCSVPPASYLRPRIPTFRASRGPCSARVATMTP